MEPAKPISTSSPQSYIDYFCEENRGKTHNY